MQSTGVSRPRPALTQRPWRRPALFGPTPIVLAACLLLLGLAPNRATAAAEATAAPSTLLLHAQVPEALQFTSEVARQRGWSILRSGTDAVTFEQAIDAESPGISAALHIEASFAESPGGVTRTLRAEELRTSPDGATERLDVTRHYRDNLLNALDSLASKWGLRASAPPADAPSAAARPGVGAGPGTTGEVAPGPALRASAVSPPDLTGMAGAHHSEDRPIRRVGAWAYYAERYAEGQGCTLGDLGAVLEGARDGAELHRVHCAGGRQILVRCLAGVCRAAP